MIPELGQFSLILALCFALLQCVTTTIGLTQQKIAWLQWCVPLTLAQSCFVIFSFVCLMLSFIYNDFSVVYVTEHSYSTLPVLYRIGAVWGGHEGSLLLWILIFSGWATVLALRAGKHLSPQLRAGVLLVLAILATGFLLFVLFTSNPFLRWLPISPLEGKDLNPILQDPGLIFHPPLLYMGYVGFAVTFAFAVVGIVAQTMDKHWARLMRPWTLMAWSFLTLGIVLGSFWAYYELGWGGFWFWDPVENASFMPWLAGAALIHSLAVLEKRGIFVRWALLLSIATFALSLLGTFLVRSGILISVHTFANDPERGIYILLFLSIVIGFSLLLYYWRMRDFYVESAFHFLSRETLMLCNNILLAIACATVFLGTLYPLFVEVFWNTKLSVGPPYFNTVFVPLMALVLFFMAFAPISRWREAPQRMEAVGYFFIAAVIFAVAGVWTVTGKWTISIILASALAFWVVGILLFDVAEKFYQGLLRLGDLTGSYLGMLLAHMGIVVLMLGVVFATEYNIEKELRMTLNTRAEVDTYQFLLKDLQEIKGANYTGVVATLEVSQYDNIVAILKPEKRLYTAQQMALSETAISSNLWRDLYVALGEPLDATTWSIRLYVKPFVRWIWLGGLLIALGAICAATDKRYRVKIKES